jgi:transcriptional regulator with XRE-family HTH domain
MDQVPTSELEIARRRAKFSQTQLAERLNVAASVVSRLEASERAEPQMAKRYLTALDTEFAAEMIEFYEQVWQCIERPAFSHPERVILWAAEEALQALDRFEQSPEFDAILHEPLQRIKTRLVSESAFIRDLEHSIAFVGDIGVGKTTALSHVTGLLQTDKAAKATSVFPTGSGRTTVCEVAIKIAPTFGIAVDCLSEDEITALVTDLVTSLETGKSGLPSELERVIRNMADLRRIQGRVRVGGERTSTVDPLKDLIDRVGATDQVVAEVLSRMALGARTKAQMILPESTGSDMEWLATNIAQINYGQHPNFSVPQRITVLLPLKQLRSNAYRLSVIDTKGVEGTTERPDLKSQLDDPRTVTVLCSKFADAPGATPLSIVKDVLESGSDAIEVGRLCLLVLPRDEEALKIIDDSGSNPLSAEEGYVVRQGQIEQQFSTEHLPPLPLNFYNVDADSAPEIWEWLLSKVGHLRKAKSNRIVRLAEAATELIENADVAKTRQARLTIARDMNAAAERHAKLRAVSSPAHFNLMSQAKLAHQSSLAAAANRRGRWDNFQVAHILGVGVQKDANLRSRDTFVRIDEQLQILRARYPTLVDVDEFLESLQQDVATWKQEFLARASLAGRLLFARHLESADSLWIECQRRYGGGPGYRADVSELLQKHFEGDEDAVATYVHVEAAIQKLWSDLVIAPLREATKNLDYESAV